MFLSKKDTPPQFTGMWYAGLLNIGVSMMNLSIYVLGGTGFALLTTCVSLGAAIFMFWLIKRKTQEILWDNLTQ